MGFIKKLFIQIESILDTIKVHELLPTPGKAWHHNNIKKPVIIKIKNKQNILKNINYGLKHCVINYNFNKIMINVIIILLFLKP